MRVCRGGDGLGRRLELCDKGAGGCWTLSGVRRALACWHGRCRCLGPLAPLPFWRLDVGDGENENQVLSCGCCSHACWFVCWWGSQAAALVVVVAVRCGVELWGLQRSPKPRLVGLA